MFPRDSAALQLRKAATNQATAWWRPENEELKSRLMRLLVAHNLPAR